jgi:RNA polymerase sigma-70 factor (ECF subfamily)
MGSIAHAGQLSRVSALNPDADLVARIIDRDRSAIETAFNDFGGSVKAMALRVVRDEALADDVVQDTFLGLWNNPERFDAGRGSLRTFLLTIAHRRAVDIVRSEVARSRREERPPDPVHYDVAEEVWSRDLSETVRRALTHLTDDEREAISLAYFGGLSYVEVAKRLGQPEGTVKSRIRKGMKKLSISLAGVSK